MYCAALNEKCVHMLIAIRPLLVVLLGGAYRTFERWCGDMLEEVHH